MNRVLVARFVYLWLLFFVVMAVAVKAQFMPGPATWSGSTAPINPGTVPGLAMWIDPSLASSVFNDTACTVAAANLDHVACIKDQSTHACNLTITAGVGPIWNVVTPGSIAYLAFTGVEHMNSTCTSIVSNVPRAIGFASAQNMNPTIGGGPILYVASNSSGLGRWIMTYSVNSAVGWMIRARNADLDGGQNAAVGTNDPGTAPVAVSVDAEYINATNNITVSVGGVLKGTGQTVTTGVNTPSTVSADPVSMGADFGGATNLVANVYQFELYTPAAAMSAGVQTQLNHYNCVKAGVVC